MSNGKKVVESFDMIFKDDFSIAESEIPRKLSLPKPYILNLDEMLMVYKDSLLHLSESKATDYMKFYKSEYGIEPLGQMRDMEAKYFSDNAAVIDKAKEEFLSNCVCVSPSLKNDVPDLASQLSKELVKMISKTYPNAAKLENNAGSIFSTLGYGNIMLTDDKMFRLITIPEFLEKRKNIFEPDYFKELSIFAATATPEEVSEKLVKNRDKAHERAWPVMKDKIWCNEKSMKIYIDGSYYISDFVARQDKKEDPFQKMENGYMEMLEIQVKRDAAAKLEAVI
jgi:hypothetical protein